MWGPDQRDDFQRLRLERGRLTAKESLFDGGGTPSILGRVISTSPNLVVGHFLMVQPVNVGGAETEGGLGLVASTVASPVPVFLIGPGVPSTGDLLVCRFIDHRWVAERTLVSGGSINYGTIPSCYCGTIPTTLKMTSADPNCNYQMFQSCTIQYGPPPAALSSLKLGTNVFTSTQTFVDPIINSAFYYYLTCQYNQFSLTRIYPTSPYGSPYRDGILYSWLIGGYGNTCSPFHLDNGASFQGSDASCSVTIDPN